MILKRSQFPKTLHIGSEIYTVRFVRSFKDKTLRGTTDPETRVISILCGLGPKESLETLIHEILHAIELEYKLKVKHRTIYDLETPIANFLRDNVWAEG